MNKLSEIEAFIFEEIEALERVTKKMKRFNTITCIVDTALITSIVITGISIAAFDSGVGLPVRIALSGTSLLLSLASAITRKLFKTFTVKQEKHDSIKLLVQSKLDSTANTVSFLRQCKTGTSLPLNFTKYFRKWKKIVKLRSR